MKNKKPFKAIILDGRSIMSTRLRLENFQIQLIQEVLRNYKISKKIFAIDRFELYEDLKHLKYIKDKTLSNDTCLILVYSVNPTRLVQFKCFTYDALIVSYGFTYMNKLGSDVSSAADVGRFYPKLIRQLVDKKKIHSLWYDIIVTRR